MKLLVSLLTLLVPFGDVGVSAQLRNLQQRPNRPFEFSSQDLNPQRAEGQVGFRKLCGDTEFTLVCIWEAEKKETKKSHSKSRRRLGDEDALDYEDEEPEESEPVERRTTAIEVEGGRRLTVSLQHVECTLGIGEKDSDDSDEEYEEYTQRVPFPDRGWELTIREAADARPDFFPGVSDYYRFKRSFSFEGIEDPNNSADEIGISATVDVTLNCRDGLDLGDVLYYSSSSASFTCPDGF